MDDENEKNTTQKLWRYIAKDKGKLFASLILSVVVSVCVLFAPILSGRGIDRIVDRNNVDFPGLLKVILILAVVYLINFAAGWFISIMMGKIASNTVYQLRKDAFHRLMRLPVSFFDTTPHGDVVSRLTNDIDAVYEGVFGTGNVIITGVITILGSFGFMLYLNPGISVIVLVITPVAVLLASFIAKRTSIFFTRQSERVGELNGFAEEMVAGLDVVRSYHNEEDVRERFRQINEELYTVGQRAQFYSSLVNPTTRVINNISYILVGCIGGLTALSSGLTVGGISAFLSYATQFAKPINEISSVTTQVQAAYASAKRIFEIIEQQPEPSDEGEPALHVQEGNVAFQDVSFSYDPSRKLITDLNLDIDAHSVVAVVGSTGAGKTTLVNLLMRFYDVDKGTVCIDGADVSKVTRKVCGKPFPWFFRILTFLMEPFLKTLLMGRKTQPGKKSLQRQSRRMRIALFVVCPTGTTPSSEKKAAACRRDSSS